MIKFGMCNGDQEKKRKGGARDESEVNIDFSRIELLESIIVKDKEFGVHFNHSFSYRFKCHKSQPILWRGIKKVIRKYIDGWQQKLPFI